VTETRGTQSNYRVGAIVLLQLAEEVP